MTSVAWRRIGGLLLLSGALPSVVALALVWTHPSLESAALRWTLTLIVPGAWLVGAALARERLVDRLRTFANQLAALREDDFSVRASGGRGDDPLGQLAREANRLTLALRDRRLRGRESEALLGKVMDQVDTGLFAFDDRGRLRLVNRIGSRWLGRSKADAAGLSARVLGLGDLLEGDAPRVEDLMLPGASGRFELRRIGFRESGRPHRLVLLIDLSRALADEERQAWKRMVQVLRHEINNSLAPINSIAAMLRGKLDREPRPAGLDADLREGLEVVVSRSDGLARLMAAYAQLTKLPPPVLRDIPVGQWITRVVALETRRTVQVEPGPDVLLRGDPDQLDQALINLVRNAVDAVDAEDGAVTVGWRLDESDAPAVVVEVIDDGPGLAGSDNLFVPFFTTKEGGSGIGLALSRQIAQAHDGRLTLDNRPDARGCIARLTVPRRDDEASGSGTGRPASGTADVPEADSGRA